MSLNGKTMFISGASRGIAYDRQAGHARHNVMLNRRAASKAARHGVHDRQRTPRSRRPGAPIVGDIRDPDAVASRQPPPGAIRGHRYLRQQCSAIGRVHHRNCQRFDLMTHQVRGTYAIPSVHSHMKGRENRILTLSPPILLEKWLHGDGP